jgi:hypothetical protein
MYDTALEISVKPADLEKFLHGQAFSIPAGGHVGSKCISLVLHLTKAQAEKIHNSKRLTKLKMCDRQMKHQLTMHGSGFFSNLWGKIRGGIRPALKAVAENIVNRAPVPGFIQNIMKSNLNK